MTNVSLDNEELLHLALSAMNADRNAEAIDLLKSLLERDPGHVQAAYLLAAMHAQVGMMDRAEDGFRRVLETAPDLAIARFQLGQLLALQGRSGESRDVLAPLAIAAPGQALGAYARALNAATADDAAGAIAELQAGLDCDQDIPALTADMQRLLARLQSAEGVEPSRPSPAPLFLSRYGRA